MSAFLDLGADFSIIRRDLVDRLGLRSKCVATDFGVCGIRPEDGFFISHKLQEPLSISGERRDATLMVLDSCVHALLLGLDWIDEHVVGIGVQGGFLRLGATSHARSTTIPIRHGPPL